MRHMRIQKIPKGPSVSWLFKFHKQINLFSLSVSCNRITVVVLYCLLLCPFGFVRLSITISHAVFPAEIPLTLCLRRSAVTASRKGSVMFSWLMSLFNACVSVCILAFIREVWLPMTSSVWLYNHRQFNVKRRVLVSYYSVKRLRSFIDGTFEWNMWQRNWNNAAISLSSWNGL